MTNLSPKIRMLRWILAVATVVSVLAVIAAGPGGAVSEKGHGPAGVARYEPPDPCRTVRDRRAHARCIQSHAGTGAEKPEYTRYKR